MVRIDKKWIYIVILIVVFIVCAMYLAYPKRIRFYTAGGAYFSDRCLGKIEGSCFGMADAEKLNGDCRLTCYGYKYHMAKNSGLPIYILRKIKSAF